MKSFLIEKLIRKNESKFSKIIIIGASYGIENGRNIVRDDEFEPFDRDSKYPTLLIFDDIIYNRQKLKLTGEVFIRGRHLNISCVLISQNIFLNDKDFRQISLNTTHCFIFKHRDLKQIDSFGRSFLTSTDVPKFVDLYKKIVGKFKYKHLLIDFTQDPDSPLFIRSEICNINTYERAYVL